VASWAWKHFAATRDGLGKTLARSVRLCPVVAAAPGRLARSSGRAVSPESTSDVKDCPFLAKFTVPEPVVEIARKATLAEPFYLSPAPNW
jgi:hypothetical protein